MNKFHYNLIAPYESISNWTLNTFPDGEKKIVLSEPLNFAKETNYILTRISNMDDLFILKQLLSVLERLRIKYHVFVTYLIGQRNDRIMDYGGALNLEIVLKMLFQDVNSSDFTLCEVHNPNANFGFEFNHKLLITKLVKDFSDSILVFPDKGARERYKNLFSNQTILECDKVRGVGLEYEPLLIINVPTITLPNKDFVVIDDLCDGGRTFIELAKELRKKYPNRKKTLIVPHAVNLNGLKYVSEHYDKIIITDSYNDWESVCIPQNVIVKKCTDLIKI